uniref:SFRICE_014179 n=1 Tax=Spodoptera frugiperda TaxID=7108 RepID=A0A2H1WCJ6_SPOFR
MTNFNVRFVNYFKTLDTYFLFSYGNKYFLRYIDLKYRVISLLAPENCIGLWTSSTKDFQTKKLIFLFKF